MTPLYAGIDPGLDGAFAVLDAHGALVYLWDTPTLIVQGKKAKREYDVAAMLHNLRAHALAGVTLEAVHAMPGQGVTSMFSMGKGFGLWWGLLAALGLPLQLVSPQRWKAALLDGQGRDKEASRFRAQQLWPAAELHLKKHEARAEALLIAEWGRRQWVGRETAP